MGVGIDLRGSYTTDGDVLELAREVVRAHAGEDLIHASVDREAGIARVMTHPAGEDIELRFARDERRITIWTKTSTVGPGYHDDVCRLCDALGARLGIAWDPPDPDEGTGDAYFATRDRAALEDEMLHWLRQIATVVTEQDDLREVAISMPMSPRYKGPPGAAVLTVTGPRDRAWLETAKADPRACIDIFPWWSPGKDAAYELGRVLVHLWLDVRFHPAATDDEERLGRDLLSRLGRAYRLDPTLAYPWHAWEALHDDVVDADDDELSATIRDRARASARIGYRRHDIVVSVGGWTITIPGSFSERFEDGTWCAWEDDRTVWATAFTTSADVAKLPTSPRDGTPVELETELLHRAHVHTIEEDGRELWRLAAELATPGHLLAASVVVEDEDDLAWARKVLGGVRR